MSGFKYWEESYYRFHNRVISEVGNPPERKNWIAENLSAYSASVIGAQDYYYGGLPVKANDCIAYLLAVYIDLPEEYDYIRACILNKFNKQACKYNWEGKWKVFKEIIDLLEDETFSYLEVYEQVLLKNYSEDDLFGNILPRVKKYIKLFRRYNNKLYYFQRKDPSKVVKKKQFKRGYDDKGHRVLYNQRGSNTHLKGITGERNTIIREIPKEKFPSTVPTDYMWLKGAE